MPSDFDMLAQIGPPGGGDAGGPTAEPSYDPRFGKQLQDAMAQTPQMQAFRELGAQSKVNADLMKLPQPAEEMSMRTDPKTGQKTVTVKTTAQNYENTMEAATNYHQVLAGFLQQSQKAEMRLRMQEEQARNQSPWIQLATALAANMAQAKDLPGWVQAAGRTSAQLNPRPEEIGARRMAVIEQGAQMAEKGAALDVALQRTRMDLTERHNADIEKTVANYTRRFEMAATKTGEAPTEDSFVKGFLQRVKGSTKEDAQAEYDRIHDMATERQNTLKEVRTAAQEKAQREFQTKWDDRTMKRFFEPNQFAKEYKAVHPDASPAEVADAVQTQAGMAKQADTLAKEIGAEKLDDFTARANVKQSNAIALVDRRYKDARENALEAAKAKGLTGTAAERQADILSARDLVGNLAKDLDRRPDLFGPVWLSPGNAIKRNLGLLYDEDVSLITADFQHAVPIMVKALHEGTRGYAANQRQWMETKVPQMSDTPERLKGKIAFMTGLLDAAQKGEDAGKAYVAAQMASESPKGPPPNRASIQGATTSSPSTGAKDSGGPHNKITKFRFNPDTKQIEAQ